MKPSLHRRAFSRAVAIVGGKHRLAVYLGTDQERLAKWLAGNMLQDAD